MSWRWALASAVGSSHARQEAPCQDAGACELVLTPAGEPVLLAAVADGAGSAKRAEAGAQLTCSLAIAAVKGLLASGGSVADVTRPFVEDWLAALRDEVAALAGTEGLAPRDYACTVLSAIIGPGSAVFFQVGDGAIVVSGPGADDAYELVFWPGTGEYENTTFFATEPDAPDHLEHGFFTRPVDEVALFSDGLQRLVLHYESRTAHTPFFRSMLSVVRTAEDNALPGLSGSLEAWLSSPQVNDRTDDDKTLILATRRRERVEAEAQDVR